MTKRMYYIFIKNDLFAEIKRVKIKMEQFKDIQRQFI